MNLDTVISDAVDLAPLPESVSRLSGLMSRAEWALPEIADVVRHDQALAARLLRMANSGSYSSLAQIGDVRSAVIRVGPGAVLALALGSSTRRQLEEPIPVHGLREGELWRHSVAAALAAEGAQTVCELRVPPEASASALLHDIGKLVLARTFDPEVVELLSRIHAERGRAAVEAELELIEANHGEVGGQVAEHWQMPSPIVEGIVFHHEPQAAPTPEGRILCDFVALADAVAVQIGHSSGEPEGGAGFDPILWERVGLEAAGFGELCEFVEDRFEEVLERYR